MENDVPSSPWQPTFGEKLVGITFNPSGDPKVQRVKELCAELADLVSDEYNSRENTYLVKVLYDHTLVEILNAQMNAVKLLTFKH